MSFERRPSESLTRDRRPSESLDIWLGHAGSSSSNLLSPNRTTPSASSSPSKPRRTSMSDVFGSPLSISPNREMTRRSSLPSSPSSLCPSLPSSPSSLFPSSPSSHAPTLSPDSPVRSVAQSVADERLKRADDRAAKLKISEPNEDEQVRQLKMVVQEERLWAVPERRLRAFLTDQGVPRKAILNANWFWLRAEAALKYNVDLEPLLSELGPARPPSAITPPPQVPTKAAQVRQAAERAVAAATKRDEVLAAEKRDRDAARAGKGKRRAMSGSARVPRMPSGKHARDFGSPSSLRSSN
jgi:hypothetical protein